MKVGDFVETRRSLLCNDAHNNNEITLPIGCVGTIVETKRDIKRLYLVEMGNDTGKPWPEEKYPYKLVRVWTTSQDIRKF